MDTQPDNAVSLLRCRFRWLELPHELLYSIFDHLPLSTTLAFALTCHELYNIMVPFLNYLVVLTQQNKAIFLTRAETGDFRNHFVRIVRVGRTDRIGQAGPWNLASMIPVLESFPEIREISTCVGTYVSEWRGLAVIAEAVGDRLRILRTEMLESHVSDVHMPTFYTLTELQLTLVRTRAGSKEHFPAKIASCFPKLLVLKLAVRRDQLYDDLDILSCLADTHFPSLRSFSLALQPAVYPYLGMDGVRKGLVSAEDLDMLGIFLQNHSDTLDHAELPPLWPSVFHMKALSLKLRSLSTSTAMLRVIISNTPSLEASIEELDIHYLFSRSPDDINDLQTAFPNVKYLTVRPIYQKQCDFRQIPDLFTALEGITIDVNGTGGALISWMQNCQHVAQRCPHLSYVEVRRAKQLVQSQFIERDASTGQCRFVHNHRAFEPRDKRITSRDWEWGAQS